MQPQTVLSHRSQIWQELRSYQGLLAQGGQYARNDMMLRTLFSLPVIIIIGVVMEKLFKNKSFEVKQP